MQVDVNKQEHFFNELFHVFNEARFNYVVLHSWQTLPKCATSDVDMLISMDEKKRLPFLLKKAGEATGWRFVQKLWYDVPWCFYYVAVSPDGKASVALDFVSDPKGTGEYRIKDSLILPHRVFSGYLYHLSPEAELAYKLAKRRVKGVFREEDLAFVNEFYGKCDHVLLAKRLEELIPEKLVRKAMRLMAENAPIAEYQRFMRQNTPAFTLFGRRWRIKLGFEWFAATIRRIFDRIKYPTGCIIYLKSQSMATVGGEEAFRAERIFPHFIFRRIVFQRYGSKVSWQKRMAVLSSATLYVVEDAREDGFDIGRGFIPVEDCADLTESAFVGMRRCLP
ncbi:MAG: hypothetical protein ACI4R9_02730 [Kiritimatiellia bacterium]